MELIVQAGSDWLKLLPEALERVSHELDRSGLWDMDEVQIELAPQPDLVTLRLRRHNCGQLRGAPHLGDLCHFLLQTWKECGYLGYSLEHLHASLHHLDRPQLVHLVRKRVDPLILWQTMRGLIQECVPICDLETILETVLENYSITQNPESLGEFVRQALSRLFVPSLLHQGELPVIVLAPEWQREMELSTSGRFLSLSAASGSNLLRALRKSLQGFSGPEPVLLCCGQIRPALRKLVARMLPQVRVISYAELPPRTTVRRVATVSQSVGLSQ
ncbi:MAG: FHIPEP family type III secretion protein [Candidatus Eremiobacteraeota bacterium]|nr:FHIPEP family type III secretion protein [Candidatus Eremiobacteraeota bacterium]MCW5871430.1 FHIPEP family type III secretion protein [Candidatus Eremiobacteraeota bacterium]